MKAIGYLCVTLATVLLAGAGFVDWLLRDGLGPDTVASSGSLAWFRFWEQFHFAFVIAAPVLLFGLWCVSRRRNVGQASLAEPNAAAFVPSTDDVFGRIASRYDLLSDVFSFGIHRLWKQRVAKVIASESWSTLLDGATGTGDIILRVLAHESVQGRSIVAADISPQMLAIAKERLARHADQLVIQQINAEAMHQVANDSLDAYSISLCLKICNRQRALGEALRVLKPGGRIVVLEASNIPWRPLHAAYLAYMSLCMPVLGWLATGGDASAYRYLLHGIREFPTAEALAQEMAAAGFADIRFERLSLGIVAIHVARKPAPQPIP